MAFLDVLAGKCPKIEVSIDFANDPTSGTTTWTDVTPFLVGYSRAPVRSNEFDQPGVTTGSVTLRNDDGRFIPENVGALVNLVTNPSFETGTTGWSAYNGGTPSQDATHTKYGSQALKVVAAADIDGTSYVLSGLTPGQQYAVSFWVFAASGKHVAASVETPTGTFVGSTSNIAGDGATFQRSTGVFTAGAGGTMRIEIVSQSGSGAQTFWIDGVQVEAGSAATTYCDGSQDNCRWSGTANASTSYRGGPYYGNVKKLRRVRVRAQWGGVTYDRFWGYVDDWPQSWGAYGKDQTVTLPLKDGFAPLETYDLAGQSFAGTASGSALSAVLTVAGITAKSLDAGQSQIPASGTLTSTYALQRVHDIAASENGVAFADGGGTIQFHSRTHRLVNGAIVQGTIGDAAGEIPYNNPQPLYGDVWPIVRVTANGGTTETSVSSAGTASFFQRTLNFPTGGQYLVTSQSEAKSAADFLVSRYAAPVTRIPSVDLVGARDTTLWPTILGLDTSDRVIFRRRFLAGGTIGGTVSVTGFVEGYGESVRVGDSWVVSVPISPADTQSYWLLGNATYGLLGQTTYLGY